MIVDKFDILFFLEGPQVPATRARVAQYQSILDRYGLKYTFLYSLPSKYLYYPWFCRVSLLKYIWAGLMLSMIVIQRFIQIICYARKAKVIFLQRDFLYRVDFPFLESFLFKYAKFGRKCKIVFDLDDAIFIDKFGKQTKSLANKFSFIANNVDLVVAGNSYLADYFNKMQISKLEVVIIPTVVDCKKFSNTKNNNHKLKIGWTGVSSNLKYLKNLENDLINLRKEFDYDFIIITNAGAKSPFENFKAEMLAWNEFGEVEQLQNLDIGLMPLPKDEWSKGKCAFKILQYMALGIVAVATSVGANQEVIHDAENGLLIDQDEWYEKLKSLILDPILRERLATNARQFVVEKYSLKAWEDNFFNLVCK